MGRVILLVLAILAAAPSAHAAQAVHVAGEVQVGSTPTLSGDATFRAAEGALDLIGAIKAGEPLALTWESAEGYELRTAWTWVDTPQGPVKSGGAPQERPLSYGAGRLDGLVCGSGCRVSLLGLGGQDSALSMEGRAEGPLRRLDAPHLSWAQYTKPSPNGFYHEVPRGAVAVGGNATTIHQATPGVSGRVGLLLADASADLESGGERTRIDVLQRTEPVTAPTGATVGGRDETGFVYLVLEGASLSAPPGGATRLLAPAPSLALEGYLGTLSATGELDVDGRPERLEAQPLQLEGNLTFDLAGAREASLPPALESAAPLRARVEGQATSVRIDGRTVASAAGLSGQAVAAGLTLAALLAAAWLLLPRLVLAPLYSRIQASQLLSHPARQALYDLIGQSPGLTPTELGRRVGVARVVVQHHLRMLETHRLVTMRRTGRRRAYFLTGAVPGGGLVEGHATLQDETRRRLAAALLAAPRPLSQADLSEMTGFSQRLVSYHLARLSAQGLVSAEGALPRRYRPTPLLGAALPTEGPDPLSGAAG